jgi:putative membrane protein
MSTLMKVLIHIGANALAILAADTLLSGFSFRGDWQDLFIAGLILGIVNSGIRPLVKLFTFPLIILTLGIFSVIINIFLLLVVDQLIPELEIKNLWAAFWGVIIISIVNNVITSFAHNKKKE